MLSKQIDNLLQVIFIYLQKQKTWNKHSKYDTSVKVDAYPPQNQLPFISYNNAECDERY